MPLVMVLQFAMFRSGVPGVLRLPIVLAGSLAFTLITYHWFVRYTVIGTVLNGPRHRPLQ